MMLLKEMDLCQGPAHTWLFCMLCRNVLQMFLRPGEQQVEISTPANKGIVFLLILLWPQQKKNRYETRMPH